MKVILAIVILTILYIFGMSKLEIMRLSDLILLSSTTTSVQTSSRSSGDISSSSEVKLKISATISGAVNKPGTYTISNNGFLEELIQAAGGLKPEADIETFNKDYVITIEKQSFYIPEKSQNEKISINNASIEELELLPSIGVVSATNIVKYRSTNGVFLTLEDILKVERIGEKTYLAIRDLIKL